MGRSSQNLVIVEVLVGKYNIPYEEFDAIDPEVWHRDYEYHSFYQPTTTRGLEMENTITAKNYAFRLNEMAADVHEANKKWWVDIETGEPIERNKGEQLCLIHSEISEAMEGERKDLMDDHLPHRKMAEVELADALIRILDYSAGHGYDIGGAFREKMEYNRSRQDHTHEARKEASGKKF